MIFYQRCWDHRKIQPHIQPTLLAPFTLALNGVNFLEVALKGPTFYKLGPKSGVILVVKFWKYRQILEAYWQRDSSGSTHTDCLRSEC